MLRLLLPLIAAALVGAIDDSVSTLDSGSDSRKVVVQIWSHSKGGPRGSPIELHLPSGQAADVAEIVAAKKVERAAAELAHSKVKEEQLKQINDEAQEVHLSSVTREKLAQKQFKRADRDHKRTKEALDAAQTKSADTEVKMVEKKQTVQFASAKKKAQAQAVAKVAETKHKTSTLMLEKATANFKKADSKLSEVTPVRQEAEEQAFKAGQAAVAAGVRFRAAKEHREEMEYLHIKAQHLAKLASRKQQKEHWRSKLKTSRKNVKMARKMLDMMDSKEGKASATKSLNSAKAKAKTASAAYTKSRKEVEETTASLQKSEEDYTKKAAFKSYISAAKASAVAADADKAFTMSLSAADKRARDQAAQEAHRILQRADERARQSMANLESVKIVGKQEKAALDAELKKRNAEEKEQVADLQAKKKDIKMSKQVLGTFGSPPTEMKD